MADKKKPQATKKAPAKKPATKAKAAPAVVKKDGKKYLERVYRGALVRKVAKKLGTPIDQTDNVIKELFHVINQELVGNKNVILIGFGSFKTSHRAKRTGRDPQTGKPITLKAHKIVRFRPCEDLKKAVR